MGELTKLAEREQREADRQAGEEAERKRLAEEKAAEEPRVEEMRRELARKLDALAANKERSSEPAWMQGGPEALAWFMGKTKRPRQTEG